MELLEIVTQGLQGAPEMVRLPFAPRITVLPAAPRERLMVRVILDLLYPVGTEPTLFDLDIPTAQSRVALTVQGRDGQRYRLLQDVHTGRRALQRMAGDKAEPMSNTASEIAQAVTATIGFPQEDVLRELMFCVREDLPSQRAPAAGASSSSRAPAASVSSARGAREDKPLPPGFSDEGAPVSERGGRSDEQLKARLAEIDETLAAQDDIKEVEFELDGLQKKLFEIEAKLRPLSTLRRSVEQAETQMQRFHSIEGVSPDLIDQGAHLRKVKAEHAASMERMEEERDRLIESSGTVDRSGRQQPFEVAKRDPMVIYGVLAGVAAVVLGLIGAVAYPPLQWAAFIDIPAFGVALVGGIRVLGSLEHGESVRRRVARIDVEKKRLMEKLRIDEEHVKSVLGRAGFALEQLPDVEEQLVARTETQAVLEQTRAALAEAEQEGDAGTLEAEQRDIADRIRALEDKLQLSGGYAGVTDLERERMEIQAVLSGDSVSDGAAVDATAEDARALFGDTGADLSGEEPAPAPSPDLCQRQLELARDVLLGGTVEDIAQQVKPRASQIFAALADNRYKELRFSGRGETSAVDAAAGQPIPFAQLPPFDRDLSWIALKVALIEVIVGRTRIPVVFDRGLDTLADSKAPLLKNMLTFLSNATQVVSISESAALGGRPG